MTPDGPASFFPEGRGLSLVHGTPGRVARFAGIQRNGRLRAASIPRNPGPCRREALLRGVAVCSVTSMTSRHRGLPIGPKEQTAPTLVKAARATRHAFLTFGDDDGYEK